MTFSDCHDSCTPPSLLPRQPLLHPLRGDPGLAGHRDPRHQVTSGLYHHLDHYHSHQVEYIRWAGHGRCLLAGLHLLPGGSPGHGLQLAALLAPDEVRLVWSAPHIIPTCHPQVPGLGQEGARTRGSSFCTRLVCHSLCSIGECKH